MAGFIAAGLKQKNEGTRVGELTLGVATALQAFPLLVAKGEYNRTNGGNARIEGSSVSNNILTRYPQYKASTVLLMPIPLCDETGPRHINLAIDAGAFSDLHGTEGGKEKVDGEAFGKN